MIVVHHLNQSRSQRVLWLLEELGLPYEIRHYQRDAKTMLAPPELKAIHPLGKSPIVCDDDFVIAESGLIIDYLIERYGNGRLAPAAGTRERLNYQYWLHYAEGSLMPLVLMKLIFKRVGSTPASFFVKPILKKVSASAQTGFVDPQLALHLSYLDKAVGASGYFVGDSLSGADIQMSFPIEALALRAGLDAYPRLSAYLDKVHVNPAYQRAIEKGGPVVLV